MKQNDSLLHLIDAVKVYNDLKVKPLPLFLEGLLKNTNETFDEIINIVKDILSKPKINTCRIKLIIDFKKGTDLNFWLSCKIFNDISAEESVALMRKIELMVTLLRELKDRLDHMDRKRAGEFFLRMIRCVENSKRLPYESWRADPTNLTLEKLRDKQIQLTVDLLEKGVLEFDDTPSKKELAAVKIKLWKKCLEEGAKIPKDFKISAAVAKRYAYWAEELLIINYPLILRGLYPYCFNHLTSEQRWALFDYDVQMKMLHQDLVALKPELAKYLNTSREVKINIPQRTIYYKEVTKTDAPMQPYVFQIQQAEINVHCPGNQIIHQQNQIANKTHNII